MADKSHIEWTDATWNPVTGCSVISPGCTHCYAMKLAGTRLRNHPSRKGLTTDSKAGPVWNGQVRFNEDWLLQPLGWSKPRMIFVCAHGDLFHEDVPDAWIDKVFAVMALAPQHTFQVLTKRAERMRDYIEPAFDRILANMMYLVDNGFPTRRETCERHGISWQQPKSADDWYPLPNVWLGVSAERQKEADERLPALVETPAAVRFVSIEPMLGPISLFDFIGPWGPTPAHLQAPPQLDWVIVGGESGQSARPMHPQWARDLRDQCDAAEVAYFFKQWGQHAPLPKALLVICASGSNTLVAWPDGTIGAGSPERNGGAGEQLFRGTKEITGRHLDGVLHDGFPTMEHCNGI